MNADDLNEFNEGWYYIVISVADESFSFLINESDSTSQTGNFTIFHTENYYVSYDSKEAAENANSSLIGG